MNELILLVVTLVCPGLPDDQAADIVPKKAVEQIKADLQREKAKYENLSRCVLSFEEIPVQQ